MKDLPTDDSGEALLIGYVDIEDSGSLALVDAVWSHKDPKSTAKHVELDLELPRHRVPVRAICTNGKRYLVIAIDEATPLSVQSEFALVAVPASAETVETEK